MFHKKRSLTADKETRLWKGDYLLAPIKRSLKTRSSIQILGNGVNVSLNKAIYKELGSEKMEKNISVGGQGARGRTIHKL